MTYDDLTAAQQRLLDDTQTAASFGLPRHLLAALKTFDAAPEDKAAVARYVAGADAAREFEETR